MAVRKTERRIPEGFVAADLGQTVSTSGDKARMVSFNATPVAYQRLQSYVVFVVDDTLAGSVDHYVWSLRNGSTLETWETDVGYLEHRPEWLGPVSLHVSLEDSTDQRLVELEMKQRVAVLNPLLEALYRQRSDVAPRAGHPATSREVINDFKVYMSEMVRGDAGVSPSLARLIFAITYSGVMEVAAEERNATLEQIAAALDEGDASAFADAGRAGVGVCQIRPHVLAMYQPQTPGSSDWYLSKREYPAEEAKRLSVDRTFRKELAELKPEQQIDLFNLLRFPKSNLAMAIQLLTGLRDQYFSGADWASLIKDREQTESLLDQFKRGPRQGL